MLDSLSMMGILLKTIVYPPGMMKGTWPECNSPPFVTLSTFLISGAFTNLVFLIWRWWVGDGDVLMYIKSVCKMNMRSRSGRCSPLSSRGVGMSRITSRQLPDSLWRRWNRKWSVVRRSSVLWPTAHRRRWHRWCSW
jgi:hypothetical protein